MNPSALLRTGIIGALVSALLCFTSLLDELLAFLGLTILLPYSNSLSVLALAAFLLMIMYAGLKKLETSYKRPD